MSRPRMSKENCELLNRAIDDIDLPREEAIYKILLNNEPTEARQERAIELEYEAFMLKGKLSLWRAFSASLIVLSVILYFVGR